MATDFLRRLKGRGIPQFIEANPHFDLLGFDFCDPQASRKLIGDGDDLSSQLSALRIYQRLARLFPHDEAGHENFERHADALVGAGFTSAHQIASYSEAGFERAARDVLDGDTALAHGIHHRALQIKAAVRHIFANARDVAGSAHTRGMLVDFADARLTDYLSSIPSFQTLFGSLDYIEVPEAMSIFSPAAYFLDLLRINSAFIDEYDADKAPAPNSLAGRRPDLFKMKIDADNTTRLVPCVDVVRDILRGSLATAGYTAPAQTIALVRYPFELPTVLPLATTQEALAKVGTSLGTITHALGRDATGDSGFDFEEALAYLGLSLPQGMALTTRVESDADVGALYGLDGAGVSLLEEHSGDSVEIIAGTPFATKHFVGKDYLLAVGRYIQINQQVRRVVKLEGDKITVDVDWTTGGTHSLYTYGWTVPLNFSTSFCERTGLDYAGLVRLLKQNLSSAEVKNNFADRFYINGYILPPMVIVDSWENEWKLGTAPSLIMELPCSPVGLDRLDRMSRFLRASRWLGLDFPTLDWAIDVLGEKQLGTTFICRLAGLGKLAKRLGIGMADAIPLGGAFRIWGRGEGVTPADPFDRTFNNAALSDSRNTRPEQAGVFDPDYPVAWAANPLPASGMKGFVKPVSEKSVELAVGAWQEPDAYKGFRLLVQFGNSWGFSPVIATYTPSDRIATFVENWTGSGWGPYTVVNGTVVSSEFQPSSKRLTLRINGCGWQGKTQPEYLVGFLLTVLDDEQNACAGIVRKATPKPDGIFEVELAAFRPPKKDGACYTISIDPSVEGRLAAALQIGKDALFQLWHYTVRPSQPVYDTFRLLDVPRLTLLWRLAKIARVMRVSVPEYILSRQLAGLKSDYIADPGAALDDARRAVDILEFCKAHRFPPYEMGWVVHNTRSTYVKPGFDPNSTSGLLKSLASSAAETLVTAMALTQAGFDQEAAKATIGLFERDRLIDKGGAVLPPTARFDAYSKLYPITSASLKTAVPLLSEAEADAALTALCLNAPPALKDASVQGAFLLQPAFDPVSSLEGVLTGCENVDAKRAAISAYLEGIADSILFRPIFVASALETAWISRGQALVVVERLRTLGVVRPLAGEPDLNEIDPNFNGSSSGWNLFAEDLEPKSNKIVEFDMASHWLTLEANWVGGQPTAITYLQLLDAGGDELWTGNAVAGGANSIKIPGGFANWGQLTGGSVRLVPDPRAAEKTAQVREALIGIAGLLAAKQIYKAAVAAQQAAVVNAAALALNAAPDDLASSLPYIGGSEKQIRDIVPMFLGDGATSNPNAPTNLLVGLSKILLVRSKFAFGDSIWRAIARRPKLFDLETLSPFAYRQLIKIGVVEDLARETGAGAEELVEFLETWPGIGTNDQRTRLNYLTGWAIADISALSEHFRTLDGTQHYDLRVSTNLLRLARPFEITAKTGADAASLLALRQATRVDLGPLGQKTPNADAWANLEAARNLSQALVAGRYGREEFAGVADELARAASARERDALLSFFGWTYNKPLITKPSALSERLLIDLQVSDCDKTSLIAQGITSVQLYMRRCRMGLEPGANTDKINPVWWDWMGSYRLWEANRRIFLYPENYLVPTQRKSASPQFKSFSDNIMQATPTDAHIASGFVTYFHGLSTLAELVIVGAYKTEQTYHTKEQQLDETTILVGRTHTTPYTYYTRTFARTTLPMLLGEQAPRISTEWEPWQEIPTKIKAAFVSPVWAFHRLFLFWSEIDAFKSSTITDGKLAGTSGVVATTTQSWSNATLKYAYKASTEEWTSAQTVGSSFPVAVSGFRFEQRSGLRKRFGLEQSYFAQPLAQAVPPGFAGPGTLKFDKGAAFAQCSDDIVHLRLNRGDVVVVAGQTFTVASVTDKGKIEADLGFKFQYKGTDAYYKIVPAAANLNRLKQHAGPGKVYAVDQFNKVYGKGGTVFRQMFRKGDMISFGGIERFVKNVVSDTELEVAEKAGPPLATAQAFCPGGYQWFIDAAQSPEYEAKVGDVLVSVNFSSMEIVKIIQKSGTQFVVETNQSFVNNQRIFVWIYRPANYFIVYPKRSDERIFVCYGPNVYPTDLSALVDDRASLSVEADSAYDDALRRFSDNIDDAKVNAASFGGRGEDSGTVLPAYVIENSLLAHPATGWFPVYHEPVGAPGMLRGTVDQEGQALVAAYSRQDMVALYFGSVNPSTTVNTDFSSSSVRRLMYNIDLKTSYVFNVGNQIGWLVFKNERDSFFFSRLKTTPKPVADGLVVSERHFLPAGRATMEFRFSPSMDVGGESWATDLYKVDRLNTTVCPQLLQRLNFGLDDLLGYSSQVLSETPFQQYFADYSSQSTPEPYITKYLPSTLMDFDGAMGQYFWEVFYHAPMLAADWIKSNQDFERAKSWYEYIFDPAAPRSPGHTGTSHYWNFRPFRESLANGIPTLKSILTDKAEIDAYNDDPFDPHAIARLRISAYAKSTVIRYIENLIAWADALFTQDTRETIVEATGLYMLANDLLGPKPQVVGTFRQPQPLSFEEVWKKSKNGEIPQFLIDLENSALVPPTGAGKRFADVPMNDISAYFGIPENNELASLWTTIEDRLFKIRHCMNINGVVRQLALFAPPIDPAALIANLAAGGSLAGGGVFSPYPIPDTRFGVLVSFAKSMAEQVISFGQLLLGALERKDGEALAKIRLSQEAQILQLATQIKSLTVEQYQKQIEATTQAQFAASERGRFYDDLIAQGLLPEERAEIDMLALSGVLGAVSSVMGAAASVAAAFPNVGSPFAMTFGGQQLGPALQNAAGWASALSGISQTAGAIFGTVSHQKRRAQEWDLQSRLAHLDVEQFATQIQAMQLQLQIAQRDLQVHTVQIAQTEALQTYYDSRFTNEALYAWMVGRLSTSYFQAYSLALEFARMAQRAFQLEYRTETAFIAATYWNDLRKGLTAGEGLRLALSQLEAAYIRNSKRLQNITKAISLRSLDPKAFLDFVRSGETVIEFNERIFDEDFPGQYMRRIVSLTVSIPALVGPYRNVHATLTQTANRTILVPNVEAVKSLLDGSVMPPAGTVENNVRVNQRVSLSQGQGDTGVFVNEPIDNLYRPFEQTGAVSSWKLSMPPRNNLIRYDAISDVIFELQYTAQDGGDAFRYEVSALDQLRTRIFTPLFLPAQQQAPDWSRFIETPPVAGKQTLSFNAANLFAPGVTDTKIENAYISLDAAQAAGPLSGDYITVRIGDGDAKPVTLTSGGSGSADIAAAASTPTVLIRIAFDLSKMPSKLKKNDTIDGAMLRDVRLILSIEGKLPQPSRGGGIPRA